MLRPVFWEDEIVAFVSNSGHWPDVGGQTPGSFPVDACDSIAEGLCIPPIKIASDDAVVEDVEKLILANLRLPISSRGDIRAMISSLQTGEKRLHELYARYGKETVSAVMQEYIRYSERLLRSAIRALPEGSFTWTDYIDEDPRYRRRRQEDDQGSAHDQDRERSADLRFQRVGPADRRRRQMRRSR